MRSFIARFGVSIRPPVWWFRFPLIPVAAAFLLVGLAAEADGDEGAILSPGSGEALVAGQVVDVVWSSFPDDVEELELLLSIDGGRYFPLRLTPQIDPRSGSFLWVVPRVAAQAARLRIRFGRDGEEIEGEPGAPFSIFLPPALRPAPFLRRDGEWWIAEDRCSFPATPGVSDAGTVDADSRDDLAAVLPSSGKRAQTNGLCRLSAAAGRRRVERVRAFGPPPQATPPGTTPRRE